MNAFRLYHASLAVLALLAYLTGEAGIIHDWLGYAVAAVLLLRLALSLGANRQFSFARFMPASVPTDHFLKNPNIGKVLLFGVLLTTLVATGTGIAMDKGRALGLDGMQVVAAAQADDSGYEDDDDGMRGFGGGERRRERDREHDGEEGMLYELHELSANLMLLMVALHVMWLVAFRRPLAFHMLFLPKGSQ